MNKSKRTKALKRVEQQKGCCKMLVVLISISTTCDTASSGSLDLDEITGKVENLKIKNKKQYWLPLQKEGKTGEPRIVYLEKNRYHHVNSGYRGIKSFIRKT